MTNSFKCMRCRFARNSQQANDTLKDFLITNHEYQSYHLTQQTIHEEQLLTRAKSNSKLVYPYIRHKKKGKLTIGPLKKDDGTLTSNCAGMVTPLANPCFTQRNTNTETIP